MRPGTGVVPGGGCVRPAVWQVLAGAGCEAGAGVPAWVQEVRERCEAGKRVWRPGTVWCRWRRGVRPGACGKSRGCEAGAVRLQV